MSHNSKFSGKDTCASELPRFGDDYENNHYYKIIKFILSQPGFEQKLSTTATFASTVNFNMPEKMFMCDACGLGFSTNKNLVVVHC